MTHTADTGQLVTEARNATLPDLVNILRTQRRRQLDVVAPATRFRVANGILQVDGTGASSMTAEGVTAGPGSFRPLASFDKGAAYRLGVPLKFLQRMRSERPDLYDAIVNGLLHGGQGADGRTYPPNTGKFLLRMFRGDPGTDGIVRAFLSNRFFPIDHLDVLMTTLNTVDAMKGEQIRAKLCEATGLDFPDDTPLTDADEAMFRELYKGEPIPGAAGGVEIRNLNLTEDSMHIRMVFPGVTAKAPEFTEGYRSPFRRGGATRADGYQPPQGPKPKRGDVVQVFVDAGNNEVGEGSYTITPGALVCVCDNGQVVPEYQMRRAHLGGQLAEGEIEWSDETRKAAIKLVMEQSKDALRKFLAPGFLITMVDKIQGKATVPVTDPAEAIKVVRSKCEFTDAQADEILRMFTLGGQLTAGGIANAVTAAAQTQPRAEDAIKLEYAAMTAMEAAASWSEAKAKTAAKAG